MKPYEKKDLGKKPVRRSKTEQTEPARVYRPRTAKFGSSGSSEPHERTTDSDLEQPKERRSIRRDDVHPKGFDKDTGYRRKSSQKDSFSKESKGDRKESAENGKSSKRIIKKSDSNYGKSTSRDYDKRDAKRPYPRDEKRSKPFGRKDEGDFRDKDSKRYKGDRKDDSYSSGKRRETRSGNDNRYKQGNPLRSKSDEPKFVTKTRSTSKAPIIEADLKTDSEGYIRLNKYIANSGLCSRREADEYIQNGMITVNGVVVDQLGTKILLTDEVRFKGKELDPERKVYILLNKPKDYITTVEDPNAKHTVMELIEGACNQRVYPVGRLDRNSTGLLLLTNDGELTKRLTHPSYLKKKIYEVGLDKPLEKSDLKQILSGIELEDETVKADAVEYIDETDLSTIGIEIHTGQNRVVRRIFEKLGYRVQRLDRVYFAGLTKKNLPRGKWRFLTPDEVNMLKMNRF